MAGGVGERGEADIARCTGHCLELRAYAIAHTEPNSCTHSIPDAVSNP